MLSSSKNLLGLVNRFQRGRYICYTNVNNITEKSKPVVDYDVVDLPIPKNIDPAETTRFSPQRTRDLNATVIDSQFQHIVPQSKIDITTDNSTNVKETQQDPHVQSYDCNSSVSLNSVMQSNVPTPFGGLHKFSHLNMPGGQWSQEGKFVSQYQHTTHYTVLRKNARSNWGKYDENATINQGNNSNSITKAHNVTSTNIWIAESKRCYSTKSESAADEKENTTKAEENMKALTKKEQLKKAFKEYGATIVVFHVAISLASLGGFYLLVSGGVDLMPILESLGLASSSLSDKIATASTFVVAYAIHKVFAPVRITFTLGAAPFIVRYLRAKGFLKPKIVKSK